MDSVILVSVVGFSAGLHSACWGAYKDSPYESLYMKSFLRSVFAGTLIALLMVFFLRLEKINAVNLGVLYAVVMLLERAFTEGVKAYIRDEPQDKYKIPSRVHMLGKVVKSRRGRLLTGLVFSMGFIFFTLAVFNVNTSNSGKIWSGMVFGLLGGMLMAVGGCLKDAPIEGFDAVKFARSPFIALFAGLFFSNYAENSGLLMLASMGVERMFTEAYKTFFRQGVPGKFKSEKPVYKEWLQKRWIFTLPYAVTWLALLASLTISIHL